MAPLSRSNHVARWSMCLPVSACCSAAPCSVTPRLFTWRNDRDSDGHESKSALLQAWHLLIPDRLPQALQSSASTRLGAFGSLLGDKAAEAAGSFASAASATALGDYLQPAAASSLLSSFRSRWQT